MVTISQMYADQFALRALDKQMNLLGDSLIRIEKMREKFTSVIHKQLCDKKIEVISYEQDVINEKMSDLLSKYIVKYSEEGFFTCRSGDRYFSVYCNDGAITRIGRIMVGG